MKHCNKCDRDLPVEDFAWKNTKAGTRQSQCKSCHRAYSKNHYVARPSLYKEKSKKSNKTYAELNRTWLAQYLTANPCVDCGESDINCLQFDHIEQLNNGKARRIGAYVNGSLKRLQQEVAKCHVRCANCHYKRTRIQMKWTWPGVL